MIALLGATGTIGRHVVQGLADGSANARALVRDPGRAGVPVPTVAADLRDGASLRAALGGADQLFLLTAHGPDQDLQEAAALDAALDAGVKRIVKVSGGATTLGASGPTSTAVAHTRSERRIESSGMRFCFLRPSFLMQNLLTIAAPMVFGDGGPRSAHGTGTDRDGRCARCRRVRSRGARDLRWPRSGVAAHGATRRARSTGSPGCCASPTCSPRRAWRRAHAPPRCDGLRDRAQSADGRALCLRAESVVTDAVPRLARHSGRTLEAFLGEHAGAFAGRRSPLPSLPSRAHRRSERQISPMITRIGHMAFRVRDLDAAVEFMSQTLGLAETERTAGVGYLTCNERHHELDAHRGPVRRG